MLLSSAALVRKEVEAVKSRGQEKAKEEEEMSVTKAQEGKMEDQVKKKRMSGFVSVGYSFQVIFDSRGMEGAADTVKRFEGRK